MFQQNYLINTLYVGLEKILKPSKFRSLELWPYLPYLWTGLEYDTPFASFVEVKHHDQYRILKSLITLLFTTCLECMVHQMP
jgi:hypothetical protein